MQERRLILMMQFQEMIAELEYPKRILSLDPGETTGYALLVEGQLERAGQIAQRDFSRAVE